MADSPSGFESTKDRSSAVYHTTARLLESAKTLGAQPSDADAVLHLLRVMVDADTLLQFAQPDLASAEFFGLPREATEGSDAPRLTFRHVDRPGWDFRAWFADKATEVKRSAKTLCELRLAGLNADGADRARQEEHYDFSLRSLEAHARAIFDMLTDGDLRIIETDAEEASLP